MPDETMNTHPNHPRPETNPRPAFRVLCAWCDSTIESARPATGLTADSHGICGPCARRHFGFDLEAGWGERAA